MQPHPKSTERRRKRTLTKAQTSGLAGLITLLAAGPLALSARGAAQTQSPKPAYLAGYLIIPTGGQIPRTQNAGYSMYVAAWPLLSAYPGHRFQTGLPGTWMFAQYDGAAPKDMYSDVEGGLGWWTDTRFPTETPKFIMGGVGPNFSKIANGPGHGAGTWEAPRGLYGVAQLSPWLLFPPDGLNLKQGTCGQLVGYGYLNLPLAQAKATTDGKDVPTGGNCWTLFLNTASFKGPVAFFMPHFWSESGLTEPRLVGQLLDTRPVDPNRQVQMETQYIPCQTAPDGSGNLFARIAPTSFPRSNDGSSTLVHQDTAYGKDALWTSVSNWFAGGAPSSGAIDMAGATFRTFKGNGYATWEIRTPNASGGEEKIPIDWSAFARPTAQDSHTYGYLWNAQNAALNVAADGRLIRLPEYFRLQPADALHKALWVPVVAADVPPETGLQSIRWTRPVEPSQEPYTTPYTSPRSRKATTGPSSAWDSPGPVAGPFKAHLGDGTVVTYCWYRFADQPAMLHAGLTRAERELMQTRVEKLHRGWPKSRNYLPPPKVGSLASIDPALIVKPPKGLGVGYVPIATRQELESKH